MSKSVAHKVNDFSLSVATVNGSGSQSANIILAKTLFRMGLRVGAKNLFPSNIAGLPTWFTIRVNPDGYVGRKLTHDIVICKNADTFLKDMADVTSGGIFFYDAEIKNDPAELRSDVTCLSIPFRKLVQAASESIKMRKFLTNMIYVGVLGELLQLNFKILHEVVADQYQQKGDTVEVNIKAIEIGRLFALENLYNFINLYVVKEILNNNSDCILIDGNSAAALGAIAGGCTFISWYPITPSSSLAESFQSYAEVFRLNSQEKSTCAVVQAEDELSAINMVIGAGWAGARAMTATSGPGLSLMAEAAGLSYFAEVPAVIWDVQRAGPSTGLPTRTMQGDLQFAAQLSHGDTEHIILLPANPSECFEFASLAFDLAEQLQTLIIVLSDLDIGMNLSIAREFLLPSKPFERGKILTAEDLNSLEVQGKEFARYRDVDGDGICYRTLPGTQHMKAAYFTRGTGHTEKATYTEDAPTYSNMLSRLKIKMQTAQRHLPKAIVEKNSTIKNSTIKNRDAKNALLAYGSSDFIVPEVRHELEKLGIYTDYIRVRALPLAKNLEDEFTKYERIYVIEQNRDGQMRGLLSQIFFKQAHKFISVLSFDGLPLAPEFVLGEILKYHKLSAGGHHV